MRARFATVASFTPCQISHPRIDMESTWSKASLLRRSRSSCFRREPPGMPPRLPNRPACCGPAGPRRRATQRLASLGHPGMTTHVRTRLRQWSLGLGESYMDGEWDCDALDELFTRLLRADLGSAAMGIARVKLIAEHLRHKLFNLRSRVAPSKSANNYDAGNDVFEAMLDSRMIYSCAYWERDAGRSPVRQARHDLPQAAPQARRDVAGHRLRLGRAGQVRRRELRRESHRRDRVQGTAGAGAAARAACRWNCCWDRDLQGSFDKVVSVGMFEHVGRRTTTPTSPTCSG